MKINNNNNIKINIKNKIKHTTNNNTKTSLATYSIKLIEAFKLGDAGDGGFEVVGCLVVRGHETCPHHHILHLLVLAYVAGQGFGVLGKVVLVEWIWWSGWVCGWNNDRLGGFGGVGRWFE